MNCYSDALDRTELRELLENWTTIQPFPEIFHNELIEILRMYWRSEGIAEVDFLTEYENRIIPLEVESDINPRSKSMKVYMEKYNPETFYRSSLLNLKKDGRVRNIPLYAISTKLYSEEPAGPTVHPLRETKEYTRDQYPPAAATFPFPGT